MNRFARGTQDDPPLALIIYWWVVEVVDSREKPLDTKVYSNEIAATHEMYLLRAAGKTAKIWRL